jgi:hypothetical protein
MNSATRQRESRGPRRGGHEVRVKREKGTPRPKAKGAVARATRACAAAPRRTGSSRTRGTGGSRSRSNAYHRPRRGRSTTRSGATGSWRHAAQACRKMGRVHLRTWNTPRSRCYPHSNRLDSLTQPRIERTLEVAPASPAPNLRGFLSGKDVSQDVTLETALFALPSYGGGKAAGFLYPNPGAPGRICSSGQKKRAPRISSYSYSQVCPSQDPKFRQKDA